MGTASSNLVRIDQPPKSVPPEQKAFHRLQKKIELLQQREKNLQRDLEEALHFYYGNIQPMEKAVATLLAERARIAYGFYKNGKKFSPAERNKIKILISQDIDEVFEILPLTEVPEDVQQMFKDLHGVDYAELATDELGHMKDDLQEMFKEMGVDVDLSGIGVNDKEEEMVQKLFQSFGSAVTEKMDVPLSRKKSRKKSRKQIKKQLAREQIEEMQKKSLNTIYRQLAKALHPDLESDNSKKAEKLELMKQVTVAYEEGNLHALLALEVTWIDGLNDPTQSRSHEQLRIYNEILKDQIETLQTRLHFLWNAPQYFHLQRFYDDVFTGIAVLQRVYSQQRSSEKALRQFVERLGTDQAESILRQTIRMR